MKKEQLVELIKEANIQNGDEFFRVCLAFDNPEFATEWMKNEIRKMKLENDFLEEKVRRTFLENTRTELKLKDIERKLQE